MPVYALADWRPEFPEDGQYWIAPNATVIGRVRMKRNASIWWGCVLRADNDWIEIGEGSNIQDGSVLHVDADCPIHVGTNVTVGHSVTLHGATVGDNSLIGMGATILSYAKIGKNCVVGAGALIPEGKEYPDNSLIVGMPGRVVRPVSEKELGYVMQAGPHYVHNWQRYVRDLKQID
jgi:carbonic anhydrase/acetyltransferase-like protein (isoleucine patch superfamily)